MVTKIAWTTCVGSEHLVSHCIEELNIEQVCWSNKYPKDQRCNNSSFQITNPIGSATPSDLLNLTFKIQRPPDFEKQQVWPNQNFTYNNQTSNQQENYESFTIKTL